MNALTTTAPSEQIRNVAGALLGLWDEPGMHRNREASRRALRALAAMIEQSLRDGPPGDNDEDRDVVHVLAASAPAAGEER